jgi:hypothetical protein
VGTNVSYGGSSSREWNAFRELWTGLGEVDLPAAPATVSPADAPPGDVPLPGDFVPSPSLDALGQALAQALGHGLSRGPAGALGSVLPRRGSGGGGAGGAGGGGGGSARNGGRKAGGGRQVLRQAERGGAAIGAATAYRDRDDAALGAFGTSLAALDAMSPRQRNNAILNLVLGDAGHPDEAAVRTAALEQVKVLTGADGQRRTAAEALRAFIGQLVVQIGLVELRDQILAGATTKDEARRKETGLKQWAASKVHGLNLAKYGTVSSLDCHKAARDMPAMRCA